MKFARFPAKDRPSPIFAAVLVSKGLNTTCISALHLRPRLFSTEFSEFDFYFLRCKSQLRGDESIWFKPNFFQELLPQQS